MYSNNCRKANLPSMYQGDKGVQALKEDSARVEKQQKELAESRKPYALKPFKYLPATLVKRQEVSDDTRWV